MGKYFRFLSCLGVTSVCNVLYGTPYPSLNEIRVYLNSKVVTKAFEDVYAGAKESGFENLKLIGEENLALTLPDGCASVYYNPESYRDWQWKFDTIPGGFFCTVRDVSVFNGKTIRRTVEASEEKRLGRIFMTRSETNKIEELTKVCRILLSEEFAKRLLTEPLLKALYDNRDAAYSCFDVGFSRDEGNVFRSDVVRFDVTYFQIVRESDRKKKDASVFGVYFHFGYDLEKHDFGERMWDDVGKRYVSHRPRLECMEIDGEEFRSNLSGFDESRLARGWRHLMLERKNKEKISEEKKDIFEEEAPKNSEKGDESFDSEEDEEEDSENSEEGGACFPSEEEDGKGLKIRTGDVKRSETSNECDPNKRHRSPKSDNEQPKDNHKKKKEE